MKRMLSIPVGLAVGLCLCGCGCLNVCSLSPCKVAQYVGPYLAMEFLTDNDAVVDLFQDDFGTGALYDDRFTAAPSREEQ